MSLVTSGGKFGFKPPLDRLISLRSQMESDQAVSPCLTFTNNAHGGVHIIEEHVLFLATVSYATRASFTRYFSEKYS